MKIKYQFILFIGLIHLTLGGLGFFLLQDHLPFFFLVEILLIASILFSIRLYRSFIRPLDLIASGTESIREKDFNIKFVQVGQPEMDQLIDVYNQMIDQLREERIAQQEQHFFLDKLLEASPSGILVLNGQQEIDRVNQRATVLLETSAEQLIGQRLDALHTVLAEALLVLENGQTKVIRIKGWQAIRAQKSGFVHQGYERQFVVLEELTHEMLETEKKAYGKVIRMMAHEVNNSIGAVNSILQSVLSFGSQLSADDRPDYERVMNLAVKRNQNLNRFMERFAEVVRLPVPNPEELDLHPILYDLRSLFQSGGENRIQIDLQLDEYPLHVRADRQQLEQVLINVLKNAREAIEGEGIIRIVTRTEQKELLILDSGCGIEEDTSDKLFSPFFSNKQQGQGIGLTLTREILLNHGFTFSLQNQGDGWTAFRIGFASLEDS